MNQTLTKESRSNYLDFLALVGVLRVAVFDIFPDRKYWTERYADLFLSMLIYDLRDQPVTLEEMTGFISGVSHSTKVRMIDEAKKDGIIVAYKKSELADIGPIDNVGARKIFALSDDTVRRLLGNLDGLKDEVLKYAATHKG